MTTNYKYTTYILAGLFIVTLFFLVCGKKYGDREMMGHGFMDGMRHDMKKEMGMHTMMMDMTSRMEGKSGAELERIFLEDMIIHHEGAIEMAQKLKEGTTRAELLEMADDIISTQTKEVETMKGWLREWFK